MSSLLTKRLYRNFLRNKLRLGAVILMVSIAVFAGITFGGYASNLEHVYDAMYEDNEQGTNLGDLWIDNKTTVWSKQDVDDFCDALASNWQASYPALDACESRLILNGAMYLNGSDEGIAGIWHGISSTDTIDRLWFPDTNCCPGEHATTDTQIVLDAHVLDTIDVGLGDEIYVGAGEGKVAFTVTGFAFHPMHVYFAPEGSIFPPEEGTFVVGYLTDEGMARLSNNTLASANTIMIDIEGTPQFDLPNTDEFEGEELAAIKQTFAQTAEESGLSGRIMDRGEQAPVEFLRQDLEGAKRTVVPFTVMISVISCIVIVLTLQRFIQSQAREIAILRTLGIPRSSLMVGYLMAPFAIGALGCLVGGLLGPYGMNFMLDFYEDIIGLPIVERSLPTSLFVTVMSATMFVVMISGIVPAYRIARLQPLAILSGSNDVRVGSSFLQRLTKKMPTTVGLSIRSSLRKPIRLSMTLLAVGISLMLFGSIQMMTGSLEDTIVGNLEDEQSWDVQVYIQSGGEADVIAWAQENNVEYEILIEVPYGQIVDSSNTVRSLSLVGLEGYDDNSMRHVNLIKGSLPTTDGQANEVLIDEGIAEFVGLEVGSSTSITIGTTEVDVDIVGITRGELQRTMYFVRSDLAQSSGVNATSVYLTFDEAGGADDELASVSSGIIERESLLRGIKSLLEQQTNALIVMMGLGILFATAVLFNTLIMNISERDAELATLRVLGASTKQLTMILFVESLLIGVLGGVIGVIFAFLGAVGLAASFSSWQFFFPVVLDYYVAFRLLLVIIFISIATLPVGVYRLRKMDLVEKVKEFSN
jgi:putative ABC transport system permease protein